VLDAINQASGRAPRSPLALWRPDGDPIAATDHHDAAKADIVIGAIAADAIALLTGPQRADLRACGAPGCVLMFLKDHPRRAWCSNTCGNRARQARHYRRARGDAAN
jgi:predicted RNA-binding Zn ribbon-like protein